MFVKPSNSVLTAHSPRASMTPLAVHQPPRTWDFKLRYHFQLESARAFHWYEEGGPDHGDRPCHEKQQHVVSVARVEYHGGGQRCNNLRQSIRDVQKAEVFGGMPVPVWQHFCNECEVDSFIDSVPDTRHRDSEQQHGVGRRDRNEP